MFHFARTSQAKFIQTKHVFFGYLRSGYLTVVQVSTLEEFHAIELVEEGNQNHKGAQGQHGKTYAVQSTNSSNSLLTKCLSQNHRSPRKSRWERRTAIAGT